MLINDKIAKTSAMYIDYLILDGIRTVNNYKK